MDFVYVAPGSYWRGSPEAEVGRDRDEGPRHAVQLSRGFYLAATEVTQQQWQILMGDNPSQFTQVAGDAVSLRPVDSVSWQRAQQFLARMNALGQGRFRLPTEAEWEYAARAGTTGAYPWGDAVSPERTYAQAWANSRSFATTHAVGQKPPNAWGLYDMHGNVWEWCQDWYAPYNSERQIDPSGPVAGTEKVFRGGSWFDFPPSLRSANRHRHPIDRAYSAIGFRVLLEESPLEERTLFLPGRVPIRFARIPAGEFSMGSPASEAQRQSDEGPLHRVRLSRDFWLGVWELSQAQWQAVMGENPSVFRPRDPTISLGVEMISWQDVQGFLGKLNQLGLGRFRLPTEAEWEYAARAGTSSRFAHGDDPDFHQLPAYAWFNPRSEGRTQALASKLPNAWGLYDMFGGLWEWVEDFYAPYPAELQQDPRGPSTGTRRIIRGGSWFNEPEALRAANRNSHEPSSRQTNIGLRLVWEAP